MHCMYILMTCVGVGVCVCVHVCVLAWSNLVMKYTSEECIFDYGINQMEINNEGYNEGHQSMGPRDQ